MVVFVLVGSSGVGKDTVAEILNTKFGTLSLSYAGPLKESCQIIFNLSDDQLHDREKKELVDPRWGLTPRQIFQKVGTDLFRDQIDKEIWVKSMCSRIETHLKKDSNRHLVVTDARFPNEVSILKKRYGANCIKLTRPKNPDATKEGQHESETGVNCIHCEYHLENNGTIEEFKEKVEEFFASVFNFERCSLTLS